MSIRSIGLSAVVLFLAAACGNTKLPDVDYSCKIQADCAVKDVGSCCGERLRCVNASFTPDLEGVEDFCRDHQVSECAEPITITSCECIDDRCRSMRNNEEI